MKSGAPPPPPPFSLRRRMGEKAPLLPAVKPTGHETVRVVVFVVGGLL